MVRVESLSSAEVRPISRTTTWLTDRRFPDFARGLIEKRSFTAVSTSYGIADYTRSSICISAGHADVEESKLLCLAPAAILLVSEAVDADETGDPISYALSRFPTERMELVV